MKQNRSFLSVRNILFSSWLGSFGWWCTLGYFFLKPNLTFLFGVWRSLVGALFLTLLKFLQLGSESYLSAICLLRAWHTKILLSLLNWKKSTSTWLHNLTRENQFDPCFIFFFVIHYLLCKRIARLYGDIWILHLLRLFFFFQSRKLYWSLNAFGFIIGFYSELKLHLIQLFSSNVVFFCE